MIVFAVSLAAYVTLLAATFVALLRPGLRLWPPPGPRSWQFRLTWILFSLAAGAGTTLGFLDWDSLALPNVLRLPVGGLLVVGGLGLAGWGMRTLSVRQTLGLTGTFAGSGPYRFTRNPQYLGDIAATLGWAVFTGSILVCATAIPAVLWYLLLPRTEEPWLLARYGEDYRRYQDATPRFL